MNNRSRSNLGQVIDIHAVPVACATDAGPSMMERMGRLFEVTHELLAVVGFDNRYKFMNAAWESVLGFLREELMANSPGTYVHPEDVAATQADVQKVLSGTTSTAFENRLRCKDGSYRWFSWYSMASPAEECFYVAGREITERKRAEEHATRLARAGKQRRNDLHGRQRRPRCVCEPGSASGHWIPGRGTAWEIGRANAIVAE